MIVIIAVTEICRAEKPQSLKDRDSALQGRNFLLS
jgi:hypothetical protein